MGDIVCSNITKRKCVHIECISICRNLIKVITYLSAYLITYFSMPASVCLPKSILANNIVCLPTYSQIILRNI